jgi:arsenate reductase
MKVQAMSQTRVLFLCTGNSCRSQMAEGWLRKLGGGDYASLSAGSKPAGYVHPQAIEVMREAGIDISSQASKSIADFLPPSGQPPDVIISVCDAAAQDCPVFPGKVQRIEMPFDDPAHATGTDEEMLACFRRVRDEIHEAIEKFLQEKQAQ